MIDKSYIDSARIIHREYLESFNSLTKYEKDVKELLDFLIVKQEELEQILNNTGKIRTHSDASEEVKIVYEKMVEIETKKNIFDKKVKDVNDKLVLLNKQQDILYETLKKKYPKMSDEEMAREIHEKIAA